MIRASTVLECANSLALSTAAIHRRHHNNSKDDESSNIKAAINRRTPKLRSPQPTSSGRQHRLRNVGRFCEAANPSGGQSQPVIVGRASSRDGTVVFHQVRNAMGEN